MSWVQIREVPGSPPQEIVTFGDNGSVSFTSKQVEKAMRTIGIAIPPEVQNQYGGEGKVKLLTDDNNVNPFFQGAYKNIYSPSNIEGKGAGEVKWIRRG